MTYPLSTSTSQAIVRTLIATIIAVVLVAANFTAIDAQQNSSAATSTTGVTTTSGQQAPIQNAVSTPPTAQTAASPFFQSTNDSFSIQIPQSWQIHDLNNSGSSFSQEITQGYGLLAQLCPVGVQQQQPSSLTNSNNTNGCIRAQQEVIHVVRYPNLDSGVIQTAANNGSSANTGASFNSNNNQTTTAGAAVATPSIDDILAYHLQKLQEVGYNSIQIVNNQATTVNLTLSQANQTITTLPAKFGEIVYTTASAPGEIKRGYFILTATNATSPNLGITKGYSLFYEGSGNSTETRTTGSFGSVSLPPPVRQVFDSFGLITVATSTEPLAVSINSRTLEGEGVAPATFEFESNVRGGAASYAYSWDFDEEEDEESNERVVVHTFDEAGTYNVRVTVTDSSGQNASDSVEIVVEEAPAEEVESEEVEEQPPVAEEDDNPASDSAGIDDVVNDFIDDLFSGLGLR